MVETAMRVTKATNRAAEAAGTTMVTSASKNSGTRAAGTTMVTSTSKTGMVLIGTSITDAQVVVPSGPLSQLRKARTFLYRILRASAAVRLCTLQRSVDCCCFVFAYYRIMIIVFATVQTGDVDDISSVSSCDSDGENIPFDWNVIANNRTKFESFLEQRRLEEEQVNYVCYSYRVFVCTQRT